MIDFLILIKALIDVGFASRVTPEDIPIVGFRVLETVGFEDRPDKARLTTENLIEELGALIRIIAPLIVLELGDGAQADQLALTDGLEANKLGCVGLVLLHNGIVRHEAIRSIESRTWRVRILLHLILDVLEARGHLEQESEAVLIIELFLM